MAHNGPAIWGGCVTRRSIRAGSWYFSQKAVTVQGGYGALFAVMVQILLSITCVAVQFLSEPRIYPRLQSWLHAMARSRYKPLQICLGCRSKSKKCDKQLTHIVRVIGWLLFLSRYQKFVSLRIICTKMSTKLSCCRNPYYIGGRGKN
jgi:hypothetical protein